jgi:Protein similar to CwfJ C-terminus 1/Protein similar to CwfJ C-terminus 2
MTSSSNIIRLLTCDCRSSLFDSCARRNKKFIFNYFDFFFFFGMSKRDEWMLTPGEARAPRIDVEARQRNIGFDTRESSPMTRNLSLQDKFQKASDQEAPSYTGISFGPQSRAAKGKAIGSQVVGQRSIGPQPPQAIGPQAIVQRSIGLGNAQPSMVAQETSANRERAELLRVQLRSGAAAPTSAAACSTTKVLSKVDSFGRFTGATDVERRAKRQRLANGDNRRLEIGAMASREMRLGARSGDDDRGHIRRALADGKGSKSKRRQKRARQGNDNDSDNGNDNGDDASFDRRERIRDAEALQRCVRCLGAPRMTTKHMIQALGEHYYVSVAKHQRIGEWHCELVPNEHESSTLRLDSAAALAELARFKSSLHAMFAGIGKTPIFFELALPNATHHGALQCVAVDDAELATAAATFKRSMSEGDERDARLNARTVLSVSRATPLGRLLPRSHAVGYFAVEFGATGDGFAMAITQERVALDFGHRIAAGVLGVAMMAANRFTSIGDEQQAALSFLKLWHNHDWTTSL